MQAGKHLFFEENRGKTLCTKPEIEIYHLKGKIMRQAYHSLADCGPKSMYKCFNKARLEVRSAQGPPATKWFSAGGLAKSEPEIELQTICRWLNIPFPTSSLKQL